MDATPRHAPPGCPARWKRFAISLGSLFLLLAGLELGARLAFPPPEYLEGRPYDPDLGFRGPANLVLENDDPAGAFEFRLSSLGFRGPELPDGPKEPGEPLRCLFVGDSFLMGWRVRREQLIPFAAEAAARELGTDMKSYSIACDGYGTTQELLLLRRHGARVQPDVVVLCLFLGNDVADNSIDLVGYTRVSPGGYVRPFLQSTTDGEWKTTWLHPARQALRKRSRFYQMIEHRLLRQRWLDPRDRARDALLADSERMRAGLLPRDYLELFTPVPGPRLERAWEATGLALSAFDEEVRSLGAKLLVAVLPHKFQVQRDAIYYGLEHRLAQADQPSLEGRVDWGVPEIRLAATLAEQEIEVLFLSEPLRRETHRTERSVFLRDGHLSGSGHELVGHEIARVLPELAAERSVTTGAGQGDPVDLPERILRARTRFDFAAETWPELVGMGWHGWRRDWYGETAGWAMTSHGELLLPPHSGELLLRGWLPEVVEVPVSIRVNGQTHEVEETGPFELRQTVAPPERDAAFQWLVLETSTAFDLWDGRRGGLVLVEIELAETAGDEGGE